MKRRGRPKRGRKGRKKMKLKRASGRSVFGGRGGIRLS